MANKTFGSVGPPGLYPPRKFRDNGDGSYSELVIVEGDEVATCTATGPTVGSSSTTILAANANRKSAVFVNDSDQTIYLARGATAYLNKGIPLNPKGGAYEINSNNLYKGVVTAICASGGKVLCVEEGV